jgi:gluconate kinase
VGRRNYLVDGVSGTGKTSVCDELQRRGYQAVHGDRELAYRGDPTTGLEVEGGSHEHHLWRVSTVRALAANQDRAATFFCGGSRNFSNFIEVFDAVFVLEIDVATLRRRLAQRPEDEFGGRAEEREFIERLHSAAADTPVGIKIDATAPLQRVVDEILNFAALHDGENPSSPKQHDDHAASV